MRGRARDLANCCAPATEERGNGGKSQFGSIFWLCFSPNAAISQDQRRVSPGGGAACVPNMQLTRRSLPRVNQSPRPRRKTGDTFMTTSHRRIALLTGASLTALGMTALTASPALAAPHDALADGTYTG